jgi:hypothetical protein
MDGRFWTALFTLGVPAVLIAVTAIWFASNPLAILALLSVMVGGSLYLMTYTETF